MIISQIYPQSTYFNLNSRNRKFSLEKLELAILAILSSHGFVFKLITKKVEFENCAKIDCHCQQNLILEHNKIYCSS